MKHTLILLLISFACWSQPRQSEPLPQFASKPSTVLSKGLTGWCKSFDGQWLSEAMTIPNRKIYRASYDRKDKREAMGSDNIVQLVMIPVTYNKDSLITLVKFMKIGDYEHENTLKHWSVRTDAHYWIFRKSELKKLRNLEFGSSNVIKINLLSEGHIQNASKGNISKQLAENVIISNNSKRQLVITAMALESKTEQSGNVARKMVRFQIHSQNFRGQFPEGIVNDFTINGNSLYGTRELLDYLYYECDLSIYNSFFSPLNPGSAKLN